MGQIAGAPSKHLRALLRLCQLRTHALAVPRVTSSKWDAALRSPDLKTQLWAVQRAHDVADRLGLSVPTWERPATC